MTKSMMYAALTCIGILVMSCRSVTQPVAPTVRSTIIDKNEFPQSFDTSRTYVYMYTTVEADSLIEEMLKADIPLSRAWLPLDNMCMDPIGPRFTVELVQDDQSISRFGFVKGIGRLGCATKLKQYIISE